MNNVREIDRVIELRQDEYDDLLAERSDLKARLRELAALMEVDIAYGKVSDTTTRRMVLDQAKSLIG